MATAASPGRGHRLRHRHHVHSGSDPAPSATPTYKLADGLQLSFASDQRFFAHRGFRRLGSSGSGQSGTGSAAGSALARSRERKAAEARRASQLESARQDDPERRRFLCLSGRSSAKLAERGGGGGCESGLERRDPQMKSPPARDPFSLAEPPVRVSSELRSSLLDFESSGLLLQSFWLPEANPLGDETKADKDQSAPLFKRRDLIQLTGGEARPPSSHANAAEAATRGTSGCVIAGHVSGRSALVGQNGRQLNLRAAWSDTPELKAQRRLSYHSLRLSGRPAESGPHLSWAAQLRDPAAKIIESSVAQQPVGSKVPDQQQQQQQQQQHRKQTEQGSEVAAEVLSKVRSGSGTARSPLKASAVFHAKRFSRSLNNRFLSVEGRPTSLKVQLSDLLNCLQQQQQQQQLEQYREPAPHHHHHQQNQQILPKLFKRQAGDSEDEKSDLQQQQQQQPQKQEALKAEPLEAGPRNTKSKLSRTAATGSGGGGRIATGRSLSKSAPTARSNGPGAAATFVPIVTQLSTASGSARRPAAPKSTRQKTAPTRDRKSQSRGRLDADLLVEVGDFDAEATSTNPPPSTPKAEEAEEDEEAVDILRVPVMPAETSEADQDHEEHHEEQLQLEDSGAVRDDVADDEPDFNDEAPVNLSRVSLTSTHVPEHLADDN